jgi:hypothetical protein
MTLGASTQQIAYGDTVINMVGKCTLDPPHFRQNQIVTKKPKRTKVYSMYSGATTLGRQIEGSRSRKKILSDREFFSLN